jgi:hypothetical protein
MIMTPIIINTLNMIHKPKTSNKINDDGVSRRHVFTLSKLQFVE